ncbi:flavin-containing monooxygenase [Georgenia thermotolerans]|uniref:SidA/IucD/PvdA family monooxygenase n=1 Tax=Georgenia thermotolerans TaxID=527326 RepID=A0A7J5UUE1_9MICO|nr:NAD(P)/FAD-dependent oxidoreductase [Georgenia thermotolerans]KAE8765880.1 SidA/IucD/PvdA family monooxygenase [Georgenia thermotolerans]
MMATQHTQSGSDVDVVVIGAGFSGLYATYKAKQLDLSVKAFDAGDDVGGVWNWNRYPGARTDSLHHTYQFSFDKELLNEWAYSEIHPSQPEVLEYLHLVADRYDLRQHYTFNTTVKSAVFNESTGRWEFETDTGQTASAKYFLTGMGLVSDPHKPRYPGEETFAGEIYHTSRWPQEPVDFTGKRVAVIGTGSSGVQIVPQIAKVASELTVFQRTPNYCPGTGNRPVTAEELQEIRENYDEVWRRVRNHPAGWPWEPTGRLTLEATEEERERLFEEMWNRGGFSILYEAFDDLATNWEANELACDFMRRKIRSIVKNPVVAEMLCPDYPYGAKRPPASDGYFESFNLPHVSLIDVNATPITALTPAGIRTSATDVDVDIIVYATGFDAITGAFTRMDIRGRGGERLNDHWAQGPDTYLGISVAGFPNMFMVAGPQSPFANLPPGAQQIGDWIGDLMAYMREHDIEFMEPTREAEVAWTAHLNEVAKMSTAGDGEAVNSWFTGANIEGKVRAFNVYFGGANNYADRCDAEAASGYASFVRSGRLAELV